LTADRRARRAFLLRKLHSLTGVLPVGAFLCEHLWTNASALRGRGSFDEAVGQIQAMPGLPAIEIFGILLPLAFHAGYGVVLALRARPNVQRYAFTRNWLFLLQRITGVVALLFLLVHLWEFRVQKWLFGMDALAFYDRLGAHLSSTGPGGVPWMSVLYLVGIGSACFHLANGMTTFCLGWGITRTRRAARFFAWAFGGLGVALFLIGVETTMWFATGSAPFAGEPAPACAPATR
jgi:succinate dehydrogenase/fumarate reductase cytochrome b subunit (b558 family)